MQRRIVVIHKDEIQKDPPLISVLSILADLGLDVSLITCGVTSYMRAFLSEKKIDISILENCVGATTLIEKLVQYKRFRKGVNTILKKYPDAVLWVEGAQTIIALGDTILNHTYVLQIHELHEESKWKLRAIGKVIHQAQCVFMPEYCRTLIYQVWFHLSVRPTVLPNKPYFLPNEGVLMKLREKYREQIERLSEKKIILYQGELGRDRDLSSYVAAVKNLGHDYVFVTVGKNLGMVEKYKKIDSQYVHIDYIPAPDYLVFTSMAYIGILGYNPVSLNNVFCAPNKIFEYSAYGLPMIGNDIPGINFLLNRFQAGEVVDERDSKSIEKAIRMIDMNYHQYTQGSLSLFNSTDNEKTIADVIYSIC